MNAHGPLFFVQLAKQYHPDRNKDDKKAQERFQEISEAYEVCGKFSRRVYTFLYLATLGTRGWHSLCQVVRSAEGM